MRQLVLPPYKFVPPYRRNLWHDFIRKSKIFTLYLRHREGIVDYECRHVERFRQSLAAGDAIILAPNHPRTGDPVVLGWLASEANCRLYAMGSWHLFNKGRLYTWAIRRMGAYSVHREGVDRQAIGTAVEILENAERPLILFPEGGTTGTNDYLQPLLDGVAFIARTAAKRRFQRHGGAKVVIHPVAIKYRFKGDLLATVDPVLRHIEQRLSWRAQPHQPLVTRVSRIGSALLALKELEYFEAVESGSLAQRQQRLLKRLLCPLEEQWLGKAQPEEPIRPRINTLRMKILPGMAEGKFGEEEFAQRWNQLYDLYLAQQIACYPPDYLTTYPSVDRVLEIVELFEEDLMERAVMHAPRTALIEVGEAIEVEPQRATKGAADPLMSQLKEKLEQMLSPLALESPLVEQA